VWQQPWLVGSWARRNLAETLLENGYFPLFRARATYGGYIGFNGIVFLPVDDMFNVAI
jgi:hypothetical protein